MKINVNALATPPGKHNPYGNITRSGLCGIGGDLNLGIDIPGPACAFTAVGVRSILPFQGAHLNNKYRILMALSRSSILSLLRA